VGAWAFLVAIGLFLVLAGLYTHWSVSLAGALLPLLAVLAEYRRRRGVVKVPSSAPGKGVRAASEASGAMDGGSDAAAQ
jgi:hypothetical protein